MKPIAVQYPQPLSVAVSDLTRVSARHGVATYLLSVLLALTSLLGSFFYKEITQSYGDQLFGLRVGMLWQVAFVLLVLAWATVSCLGLLCTAQKGRVRTFGVATLCVNLAAAALAACTML